MAAGLIHPKFFHVAAAPPTQRSDLIFVCVLSSLWVAAVVDPIGRFFMLRYAALAGGILTVALSGAFVKLLTRFNRIDGATVFYISVLMPIYGLLVYAVRGGNTVEFIDTSYISSGVILLFAFLYRNGNIVGRVTTVVIFVLRALSISVVTVHGLMLVDLGSDFLVLLRKFDIAIVASREYAGLQFPYIYFLASPMLIFLVCHDLYRLIHQFSWARLMLALLATSALFMSGTRAHIIIAVFMPIAFLLAAKPISKLRLISIPLAVFLVVAMGSQSQLINSIFSASEANNAMKLEMIGAYLKIFDNPWTLVFGQGYNAHAWSAAFREIIAMELNASKTELTYIELLRVYGALLAVPFFLIIGLVSARLTSCPPKYRWLLPAWLVYLVNAAFNPYLFSSNGMLPLGLILAVISLPRQAQGNSHA